MKRLSFVAFVIAVFVLSGCVTSDQKKLIDTFEASYHPGQVVTGFVIIGKKHIPLPEGDWVVLALKGDLTKTYYGGGMISESNNQATAGGSIILVQIVNGEDVQAVYINARTSRWIQGRTMVNNKTCTRTDVFYQEALEPKKGFYDCIAVWGVHFEPSTIANNKLIMDSVKYLAENYSLQFPSDYVIAEYYVTNHNDYILAQYLVTPGFDNWKPKGASWKYPVTDKDQLKIIDRVIEWGKNWRSRLQKAVYRVGTEQAYPPKSTAKDPSPSENNSTEQKFEKLKKLHDGGLITDEEYKREKAKLLSNM